MNTEKKKPDKDGQRLKGAVHTGNATEARRIIEMCPHLLLDPFLLIAALHGDVEMVNLLLDNGADVNYADKNGLMPLHYAALNNSVAAIHLLVDRGAQLNARTLHETPRSALDYATFKDHGAAAQALLNRGTEFYFPYRHKLFSSLYVAARNNSLKCFKILLRQTYPKGIVIDSVIRAMQGQNIGIIKSYLDEGGNPNAKTYNGNTLLHCSAINHSPETVQLLLSTGANPTILNDKGETPLDVARSRRSKCIFDILKEASDLFPHPVPSATNKKEKDQRNNEFKVAKFSNRNRHSSQTTHHSSILEKNNFMQAAGHNREVKGTSTCTEIRNRNRAVSFNTSSVQERDTYASFEQHSLKAGHKNKIPVPRTSTPLNEEKHVPHDIKANQNSDLSSMEEEEDKSLPSQHKAETDEDTNAKLDHSFLDRQESFASIQQWPPCTAKPAYVSPQVMEVIVTFPTETSYELHEAVQERNIKKITKLLQNGTDINALNGEGKTVFHLSASLGFVDCFHLLIEHNHEGISCPEREEGNSPLHLAAMKGHKVMCEYILSLNVDPNVRNNNKETPLFFAVKNYEVTALLIKYNADVNSENEKGTTLLHFAVREGTKEVILMLVENGADVNAYCESTMHSSLHWAALYNRTDVFDTLIVYGGDYQAITKDRYRDTVIHLAANKGNVNILRMMKDNHLISDINKRNKSEQTPLHLAALSGNRETVQYLLEIGADINITGKDIHSPLHAAAAGGHIAVIRLLMGAGADPNLVSQSETPMHFALRRDMVDCLQLLLDNGGILQVQDSDPLLFTAIQWCALKCIHFLVQRGADVNQVHKKCITPIHFAVLWNQPKAIPILLESGADINSQQYHGRTPIHLAIEMGSYEMLKQLKKYNADLSKEMEHFITPLYLTILNQRTDLMILLKKYKKPINNANRDYRLHWAARHKSVNCVQWLVDIGGDCVNQKNANGETPLHLAVQNKQEEIQEFLLRRGADVNARMNEDEDTPLHIAVSLGHVPSVIRLLKYNADINACLQDSKKTPLEMANDNMEIIKAIFENHLNKRK